MISNTDLPHQPDTIQQQASRSFKPLKLLLLIAPVLLIALVAGTGGYLLGIKTTQIVRISPPSPSREPIRTTQNAQRISLLPLPTTLPTPILPQISIPLPKTGYEERINGTLRYGYYDSLSSSLNELTLRVETLGNYNLNELSLLQPSFKPSYLLDIDLNCEASGPQGSKICKNTKVEAFTNSLGFKGFKVYRNVIKVGIMKEEYHDVAYVFPLQKRVKGKGLTYYEGVFFYVNKGGQPTQQDLSALEAITNSFFSF